MFLGVFSKLTLWTTDFACINRHTGVLRDPRSEWNDFTCCDEIMMSLWKVTGMSTHARSSSWGKIARRAVVRAHALPLLLNWEMMGVYMLAPTSNWCPGLLPFPASGQICHCLHPFACLLQNGHKTVACYWNGWIQCQTFGIQHGMVLLPLVFPQVVGSSEQHLAVPFVLKKRRPSSKEIHSQKWHFADMQQPHPRCHSTHGETRINQGLGTSTSRYPLISR